MAVDLTPQAIRFGDLTVNLLSIGQLTHKFSLAPSEDGLASECYTHRSETMEQVLCWTKTAPDFEPNFAGAFLAISNNYGKTNLLGPSAYLASPRSISGFQAIEFEAYLQDLDQVTTIRSLLWATSGNVWHVTFIFVTGNPAGEATVERVYSSVSLEGEAQPVEIYGDVPEQPLPVRRGSERMLLQVTSTGDTYLNGREASLDEVKKGLKRLGKVGGTVLYDRAGGKSPSREAETVSTEILFAIGMEGVEFYWVKTSQE